MSSRRQLSRSLALPAAWLLAAAPLSCKQKAAPEIPVVDDEAPVAAVPVDDAPMIVESEPPPSVHVRVSVRELSAIFDWTRHVTGVWTGEPFDADAQAQAMLLQMGYGPGMWSNLNWKGLMAIDFQVPLSEDSIASDFRAFGTLATGNARAVVDAVPEERRPQPLGNGIWEMVDENVRVLFREQPAALEFAFVQADLDRASGLPAEAAATEGRRIQVVADGIPAGWFDARDFVDLPPDSQAMRQISAVVDGLSAARFELGAGMETDLQLHLGAVAPFEKLGLDPLGPPRLKPTALEGRLPGNPVMALSMPWGTPELLHKSLDTSVPLDQIPDPFNKIARDALGGVHDLLDQVKSDVALGLYLTKSGRVALLVAAEVKDDAAGAKAIRTINDAVVQSLESYRELAGGSAEVSFKVTFKSGGGRLGPGNGDLLRIGVPKNMAGEADRIASFLTKKKELEVITGAQRGVVMLALGGGASELWADRNAGILAGDSGLAQARLASNGCQFCVTVDPVGMTRLIATMARDRSTDAKLDREYGKILGDLKKLGDLGHVGFGVQMQAGRGALGLGVPSSLLAPEPAVATKVRALFERVWDAYFEGERPPMASDAKSESTSKKSKKG